MSKRLLKSSLLAVALLTCASACFAADAPTTAPAIASGPRQESASGITHSFLALGAETYIMSDDGKVLWSYPKNTRDGWVRPDGNVLLAVTKCKEYPGGAAVEVTRDGRTLFEFKGTQSEVNTVQFAGDGRYMLTEGGPRPRLIEVDRDGKVLVEVQIQASIDPVLTQNYHLQTRMSRKLTNGDYLVPQLVDKVVREYAPDGKIVWEVKTPDEPRECWPFTAIRLDNGNTLIDCTHGLQSIEVDKQGKIAWQLTNADLPSPMLKDPCGAQRLPNGNTVITSYGQNTPGEVKLLEVTPEKKVVWTYRDDKNHGIHEFQILDSNGKPVEWPIMK